MNARNAAGPEAVAWWQREEWGAHSSDGDFDGADGVGIAALHLQSHLWPG